jgi:hypothetical protein
MTELSNIEFFHLYQSRAKKVKNIANCLRKAFERRNSQSETLSEKQVIIKANAKKINSKL